MSSLDFTSLANLVGVALLLKAAAYRLETAVRRHAGHRRQQLAAAAVQES
jgi:hypothetical protein